MRNDVERAKELVLALMYMGVHNGQHTRKGSTGT